MVVPEFAQTQNFIQLNSLCVIEIPQGELFGIAHGIDSERMRAIVTEYSELQSPEEIKHHWALAMVEKKIYQKYGYGKHLENGIMARSKIKAIGKPNLVQLRSDAMNTASEVDSFYYDLAFAKPVETLHYLREKAHARGMSDEEIKKLGESPVGKGNPQSKEEFENNLMAELITFLGQSTNSRLDYLKRTRETISKYGKLEKDPAVQRFVMDFLLRGITGLEDQLRRKITMDSGNTIRQASTQTNYHSLENLLNE